MAAMVFIIKYLSSIYLSSNWTSPLKKLWCKRRGWRHVTIYSVSKHFPAAWSLPQNTAYFAFFQDFSHLFTDSDHFFRDPSVPLTFYPAATLVAVYDIPIKIREKNNVLTQHSVNGHTSLWVRSKVCVSHAGGLIRRRLFLESLRSAICRTTLFQAGPLSGQKDGAKTAQNMVYKTSTAAEVRACAKVKNLALE